MNNTATRNIHGGLNSIFSGNTFGGTFNVVKQAMKNFHLLSKSIGELHDSAVNKCVKLKSKLQLKRFISLKICHLLECVNHRVNCID